jgi:hypothetical protein
MRIVLR